MVKTRNKLKTKQFNLIKKNKKQTLSILLKNLSYILFHFFNKVFKINSHWRPEERCYWLQLFDTPDVVDANRQHRSDDLTGFSSFQVHRRSNVRTVDGMLAVRRRHQTGNVLQHIAMQTRFSWGSISGHIRGSHWSHEKADGEKPKVSGRTRLVGDGGRR